MAFVITEPCISTCDTACVAVCPVDCIHGPIDKEGAGAEVEGMDSVAGMQLYIHPEECIDCGACQPECPVDAILSLIHIRRCRRRHRCRSRWSPYH